MFESYLETLRAAEQGLGIAFGLFPMTNEWVGNGRLTAPLRLRIPFSSKICLVYRKTDARDTFAARPSFLWFIHTHGGAPDGEFGVSYGAQTEEQRRRDLNWPPAAPREQH